MWRRTAFLLAAFGALSVASPAPTAQQPRTRPPLVDDYPIVLRAVESTYPQGLPQLLVIGFAMPSEGTYLFDPASSTMTVRSKENETDWSLGGRGTQSCSLRGHELVVHGSAWQWFPFTTAVYRTVGYPPTWEEPCSETGSYQVQITAWIIHEESRISYRCRSNWVDFRVTPPRAEDAKAYEFLRGAGGGNELWATWPGSCPPALSAEVLLRFPGSRLAGPARATLLTMYARQTTVTGLPNGLGRAAGTPLGDVTSTQVVSPLYASELIEEARVRGPLVATDLEAAEKLVELKTALNISVQRGDWETARDLAHSTALACRAHFAFLDAIGQPGGFANQLKKKSEAERLMARLRTRAGSAEALERLDEEARTAMALLDQQIAEHELFTIAGSPHLAEAMAALHSAWSALRRIPK